MNERQLTRHVYWPSRCRGCFSSLHTSVGFAVVGAVSANISVGGGARYLIQQAEGVFDIAGVFAGMFVLSVFVILIDVGVTNGRTAGFWFGGQQRRRRG